MVNFWWASRPKRKLNSVPEVLAVISAISLDQEWEGQRSRHLSFEDQLEVAGIKRVGERRDQSGSGARTYIAWLKSLGLLFKQESSGQLKLTLAGETYSDPVNVDLDHFLPLSNLDIIPPVKLGVARTLYFLASMDHLGSWVFSHAESMGYDH